jgi:hypothetical protein
MASDSSNNYDYEDDFEGSESAKEASEEKSIEFNRNSPLKKSEYSKKKSYKASESASEVSEEKSVGLSRGPPVQKTDFSDMSYKKRNKTYDTAKKQPQGTPSKKSAHSFRSLKQENETLREKLKNISQQLSSILENSHLKSLSKQNQRGRDLSDVNITRFHVYINEYMLLKHKVEKLLDPEYLIRLRKEIKEKEDTIFTLERSLKRLKKAQANQGKNLGKIWVEDFVPNELTAFGHLNDQLYKYKEMTENLDSQRKKEKENYEKLNEKEEELNEKISKLGRLVEYYKDKNETPNQNRQLRERFFATERLLEKVRSISQGSLNKYIAKEKSLLVELEMVKRETRKVSELIENKETTAEVYRNELQAVANNVTQHDLGHLLSFIKISPDSENTTLNQSTKEKTIKEKTSNSFITQLEKPLNSDIEKPFSKLLTPDKKNPIPSPEKVFKLEQYKTQPQELPKQEVKSPLRPIPDTKSPLKPIKDVKTPQENPKEITEDIKVINENIEKPKNRLDELFGVNNEPEIPTLAVKNRNSRKIMGNGPRSTAINPEIRGKSDSPPPFSNSSFLTETKPKNNLSFL